jgi:integrase
MPSVWIARRTAKRGTRYRVMWRVGGRESAPRYGGAFGTMREARIRRDYIAGELAALRLPDLAQLAEPPTSPTLREAAERWRASRVDASENTRLMHRSAVRAMLPLLGSRPVEAITPADVSDLIAELAAKGRKRETIRKSLLALGMVLDFAGVQPNPARDRVHVKLPRAEHEEISPPSAEHVEAVVQLLPSRYRLPALVLDGTGMRVGELERLAWGDVDEARGRWRVPAGASKTGRARWVQVPPDLFAAVSELVPRDDRTPERPVFQGFGADRFRTALTRACTAAAVPHFSPHDLRHRRISLLHLAGVPWARIGERVGQRSLRVTADTYTHVLSDERELDYGALTRMKVSEAAP